MLLCDVAMLPVVLLGCLPLLISALPSAHHRQANPSFQDGPDQGAMRSPDIDQPMGVAADYSYQGSQLAAGPESLSQQTGEITTSELGNQTSAQERGSHLTGSQKAPTVNRTITTGTQSGSDGSSAMGVWTHGGSESYNRSKQPIIYAIDAPEGGNTDPPLIRNEPPPILEYVPLPALDFHMPSVPIQSAQGPELLSLSNLFVAGQEKPGELKLLPNSEPSGTPGKVRGTQPIPGLGTPVVPLQPFSPDSPAKGKRKECDPLVDTIFALDSIETLWLARDAIRYYVSHIRPAGKARFGLVLCGERQSFYTTLHNHFSGLLGSLEDLQHANATLDAGSMQQPDRAGHRADNNPYPPSVSSDFARTDAGCLETAYHMFMYQRKDHVDRLLAVIGSKERWGNPAEVEEARFLQALNISIMVLADGTLSTTSQTSLQNIASSRARYRSVTNKAMLHELPAIIADVICLPFAADLTVPIQLSAAIAAQKGVHTECRLLNSTALERTMDYGQHFGLQKETITCMAGTYANTQQCACV